MTGLAQTKKVKTTAIKALKKTPKTPPKNKVPPPLFQSGTVPLVVLDANILIPEYLRAVFLDLGDAGLLRPYWSAEILKEVRRNLISPKFGLSPVNVDHMLACMKTAFPDALVQGYQKLEKQFALTVDKKDLHVAAAAWRLSQHAYGGQSVVLATSNMKDLPNAAFTNTQVTSARPDRVLQDLLTIYRAELPVVLKAMCKRFKKPAIAQEDLLGILENSQCKGFAAKLAAAWGFKPEV